MISQISRYQIWKYTGICFNSTKITVPIKYFCCCAMHFSQERVTVEQT